MREPIVNELVRLTHDVPERRLHKDEVGVVCSIWVAPEAYEVEFELRGDESDGLVRVLLLPEQFEVELALAPGCS